MRPVWTAISGVVKTISYPSTVDYLVVVRQRSLQLEVFISPVWYIAFTLTALKASCMYLLVRVYLNTQQSSETKSHLSQPLPWASSESRAQCPLPAAGCDHCCILCPIQTSSHSARQRKTDGGRRRVLPAANDCTTRSLGTCCSRFFFRNILLLG